jgi:hypothetical protein
MAILLALADYSDKEQRAGKQQKIGNKMQGDPGT